MFFMVLNHPFPLYPFLWKPLIPSSLVLVTLNDLETLRIRYLTSWSILNTPNSNKKKDSTTNASSSGFAETTASFLGSSASNTTFSKSSENVSTTGHSDTNPAFNKNQSINIGFTGL